MLNSYYDCCRKAFVSWIAYHHDCPKQDAEDIFQDVFIGFYEEVKSGKRNSLPCGLMTHLCKRGLSIWINEYKHHQRQICLDEDLIDHLLNYCRDTTDTQDTDEYIGITLEIFLATLAPRDRKILEFYYIKGYSWKNIARMLKFENTGALRKRKHEILTKLRKMHKGDNWLD